MSQQKSENSDSSENSECRSHRTHLDATQNQYLFKNHDVGLTRKPTFLRRFWGNHKPITEKQNRISESCTENQYYLDKFSMRKSVQSLSSTQSSAEQVKYYNSANHKEDTYSFRKISSKYPTEKDKNINTNVYSSPIHRKTVFVPNKKCQNQNDCNTSVINPCDIPLAENTLPMTASSEFTESTVSTTYTARTETESDTKMSTVTTIKSDTSDSAYRNSHSIYSNTSNLNTNTTSTSTGKYGSDVPAKDKYATTNSDLTMSNVSKANMLNFENPQFIVSESSTQTLDTANLNVISNVQLSQSTLNLIFNQILQDVQNKRPNTINIKTMNTTIPIDKENLLRAENDIINVQQIPSFYLNRKEDIVISPEHSRIMKYMISNVGSGSAYSKPAEIPQVVVPRYSALPRTSSMEVNTSSGDYTEKDFDSVSLVDSLEDPVSPRDVAKHHKCVDKIETSEIPILLPDNSDEYKGNKKSSVFFIPIENDKTLQGKSVADHLPAKVKEKLSKRQQRRERKCKSNSTSPQSDSNYISASENGIQYFNVNSSSDYFEVNSTPTSLNANSNKILKKDKMVLPNIHPTKRTNGQSESQLKFLNRKSSAYKYDHQVPFKPRIQTIKQQRKKYEKLSPMNKIECDKYSHNISHDRKNFEVLEITENIDEKKQNTSRSVKSKIPILVQQKLPKIQKNVKKPIYLDFTPVHIVDPKVDQLIANILIDTLNNYHMSDPPTSPDENNFIKKDKKSMNLSHTKSNIESKYQQQFEVIPEELSQHSWSDEFHSKNELPFRNETVNKDLTYIKVKQVPNNDNVNDCLQEKKKSSKKQSHKSSKIKQQYKGRRAVSAIKDDDLLSIPQGWITFYLLHKSRGSPDSTSDEGINIYTNYQNV